MKKEITDAVISIIECLSKIAKESSKKLIDKYVKEKKEDDEKTKN
jgi:hypothetical protein